MEIIKASAGDIVRVRQHTWRIRDVRSYDHCALVTLAGIGSAAGIERRVLSPFDIIEPIPHTRRRRIVTRQRWRHACRQLLAANLPIGGLRSAGRSRIELLPHQLAPALAIVRGLGSRVLIADDVGLGKTIEAALVLSELRDRGAADRVLILTPAGLRDQWVGELANRFAVSATLVDSRELRRRQADLPIGVNPWSTIATAVASFDFVKRPDVLPAVSMCRWDMVVVDEAHNVAGDTDRHRACSTLASSAPYVVLLTATPHSGDRNAFHSLCSVGAHDDPLLIFRRTRHDVGIGRGRRIRLLRIRPSAAERRMHSLVALLNEIAVGDMLDNNDESDGTWLALAVFNKRALSSAGSLQRTVERRLAADPATAAGAWQLGLPLFDADGETDRADEPPDVEIPFRNPQEGRALLEDIAVAARAAVVAGETKIAAVVRLLRRVSEPAVVFTEYRDTLENIERHLARPAAVLHGGLSRDERRAALEEFATGRRPVLLATDAAGEGLNLHKTCRLVINFELPWNPMRLEQRIGRVDRIGQCRLVHAIHLVGRDTSEMNVLARLRIRVARAKGDVGAADPLPATDEHAVARAVIGGRPTELHASSTLSASETSDSPLDGHVAFTSLAPEAALEKSRVAATRQLLARTPSVRLVAPPPGEVWLTIVRNSATRAALRGRALLLFAAVCEDGTGTPIASTLVPVAVDWRDRRSRRNALCDFVALVEPIALAQADGAASAWREEALSAARRVFDLRLARERAIAALFGIAPRVVQRGLFDRRAERQEETARKLASDAAAECARRIHALEDASRVSVPPVRLVLVVA